LQPRCPFNISAFPPVFAIIGRRDNIPSRESDKNKKAAGQ
jgi:hypothetical protein